VIPSRREVLAMALFGRHDRVSMAGILFREVSHGSSRHRYLHIHGNETTAREVLLECMKTRGGKAFLIESDTRNVSILGGKIDPNRMFSREGSVKSLKDLNPQWTDAQINAAASALERDRPKFLRAISPPKHGRMVSMHNNSNGYSVDAEIASSDRVSLKDAANPRDFFLATNGADFDALARSPFNVVLQEKAASEDDGSLSRLAAKSRMRYINLECALGKIEKQREMLRWLEERLR
jgi:hypothetical protein